MAPEAEQPAICIPIDRDHLPGTAQRFCIALALLHPICDRFTEGFDTTDLKTAK